jgi:hypothetical protein
MLIVMLYAMWAVHARKTSRKQFEADPHNADPVVLTADDAGLHFVATVTSTHIAWPGVRGVVRMKNFLAVLDAQDFYHVIPYDAFGSPDAVEAFVGLVESSVRR